MTISQFCHHTSSGGALDKALHDEEGLVHLLHGAGILAHGSGDGCDAHRTTLELVDDGQQDLIVDFIETVLVYIQGRQGNLGDLGVDLAVALHLCEVPHASEQCVGDTWRSS